MNRYLVYSPDYAKYPQTESEPAEYGADCVEVEARNVRDAVMLGVQEIMRTGSCRSWARSNREDRRPPWAGYKAELIDPTEPPQPSSPEPPAEPS